MKVHPRRTVPRTPRRAPEPAMAPMAPGLQLGRVLGRQDGEAGEQWLFRVRAGGHERVLACDPSVDPALVVEAIESGARVVVEGDVVVGLLATARALTVGRDGAVAAEVTRFEVTADEGVLLRSAGAFVQVRAGELELFGNRVLTRARELVKVLGRMVKIN